MKYLRCSLNFFKYFINLYINYNRIDMIIKTKFLCKSDSRISRGGYSHDNIDWDIRFIEGKWYDGEYETWSFEEGYLTNNGWRRYWVINEKGRNTSIYR